MDGLMNVESKVRSEGKYLIFLLGREEYGLRILTVREIVGYMAVTALPQTPDYIGGVVNLRGQVIPVVDLRVKFGMPRVELSQQSCIIVVEVNWDDSIVCVGLMVDGVREVLEIERGQIDPAPEFGVGETAHALLGLGKVGQRVIVLLDIEWVLAGRSLDGVVLPGSEMGGADA